MASIRLYLFGSPTLEHAGQRVEISSRPAAAALAYLALHAKPLRREALATLLWPDAAPEHSRARLRRLLYDLRQLLGGEHVLAIGDTVEIPPDAIWVDTTAFREMVAPVISAGALPDEAAAAGVESALELAAAEFMHGFALPDSAAFDDWQFYEREGLLRLLDAALDRLAGFWLPRQDYARAAGFARRRLGIERLNEPAVRQLMTALALAGQHNAALRQFEQLGRLMQAEFGLEPEAETRRLFEAVQARRLEILPPGSPPPPAAGAPEAGATSSNAPPPAAPPAVRLPDFALPLIGRRQEMAALLQALGEPAPRLVTITGPGGSGKTRLAVAAARRLLEQDPGRFPGGLFFVDLAPLTNSQAIPVTLAAVLDLPPLPETHDLLAGLLKRLHRQRLLLILDNFELFSADAGALDLVNQLLAAAPEIKLLITSRARLNVQAEQFFPLGGLDYPPEAGGLAKPHSHAGLEAYSAVALFVECARRAAPGYQLAPEDFPHVVRICTLAGGSPLGIELACAWLALLSPAEIAAEIERCLDFLEAEWRDLPPRQRSLRAVCDASWQALSGREQDALRSLALFRGGFTRQAAEQVGRVDLRLLLALAGKSWLQRHSDGRFNLHELLRQYANDRLDEVPAARRQAWERYSAYYADFLEAQGELLKGQQQRQAAETITGEYQNLRSAWLYLADQGQFDSLRRMLFGLVVGPHFQSGLGDVNDLLAYAGERLAAHGQASTPLAACLQVPPLVASTTFFLYAYVESFNEAEQQRLAALWERANQGGWAAEMGYWFILLTNQYGRMVSRRAAIAALDSLLPALRSGSRRWELGEALAIKASLLGFLGRYQEGLDCLQEAIQMHRALGDRLRLALFLGQASSLAGGLGEQARAEAFLLEGQELLTSLGAVPHLCILLFNLAQHYRRVGRYDQVFRSYELGAQLARQINYPEVEAGMLSFASIDAVRYGDLQTALQHRLRTLEIYQATNDAYSLPWAKWELGELQRVLGNLEPAREGYEQARAGFAAMQMASGLAYYARGLGDLALAGGRWQEAGQRFQESLELAASVRIDFGEVYALCGLARAAAAGEQFEAAEAHLAAAQQKPFLAYDPGLGMLARLARAELCLAQGEAQQAYEIAAAIEHDPAAWHETRALAAALCRRSKP